MEGAAEKLYMKTKWLVAQIVRILVPRQKKSCFSDAKPNQWLFLSYFPIVIIITYHTEQHWCQTISLHIFKTQHSFSVYQVAAAVYVHSSSLVSVLNSININY